MKDTNKLENITEQSEIVYPQDNVDGNPDKHIDEQGNVYYISSRTGKKYNGDNLNKFVPGDTRFTPEERVRYAKKANQKSVEVRRERAKERRTAQEILKALCEYKMPLDHIETVVGEEGKEILGEDRAAYSVMLCRMMLQGMDGDTKAAQFVRDTLGDAPVTKTENTTEIITSDDVALIDNIKGLLTG